MYCDGSEDEEELCPLCCETLDVTDRNFFPCHCGYQVCLYCWNHIKQDLNGLCPACRTPYRDDPHVSPVDREEIIRKKKEKKRREKEERKAREIRDREKGPALPHSQDKKVPPAIVDRSALRNVRVVQRNLAYVIGIPPSIASEDILRRPEYFGQYGKIVKVAVNRNPGDGKAPGCCAYVTFAHKEDARACIQALDNFTVEGRVIRASFGTTKYCNTFLRYLPCHSADCLFLHEVGPEEDSLTKDELAAWQTKGLPGSSGGPGAPQVLVGHGGPSGTGRRCAHPVFPPPRFEIVPGTAGGGRGTGKGGAANPWQPTTPQGLQACIPQLVPSPSHGPLPAPHTPQRQALMPAAGGGDSLVPPPTTQQGHTAAVAPPAQAPTAARGGRATTPTGPGGTSTPAPPHTQPALAVNGAKPAVSVSVATGAGGAGGVGAARKPQAPPPNLGFAGSPLGPTPMQAAQILAASKGGGKGKGAQQGKQQQQQQQQQAKAQSGAGGTGQEKPPAPLAASPPPSHSQSQPPQQAPAPPQPQSDPPLKPQVPSGTSSIDVDLGESDPLACQLPPPSLLGGSSALMEPSRSLLGDGGSSSSSSNPPLSSSDILGLGSTAGGGASSLWSTPTLSVSSPPLSLLGTGPTFPLSETLGFRGPGAVGERGSTGSVGQPTVPPPPPGIGLLGPPSSDNSVLMGAGGLFSNIWGPTDPPSAPIAAPWDRAGPTDPSSLANTPAPPTDAFSKVPGAAQVALQNGFNHSVFPFQITSAAVDPDAPGGDSAAGTPPVNADPFTSTESLAKILGLSLPDHPDSLSARAARGGLKHTSRFSFANDEAEDGGLKGAPPLPAPRQLQSSQPPHAHSQSNSAPGSRQAHGQPPSTQLPQAPAPPAHAPTAQPLHHLGAGGVGPKKAGGPAASSTPSQPRQSGMAMLQQLLPNDPFTSTESLAKILGLSLPDHPDSLAAQAARGHGNGKQATGLFGEDATSTTPGQGHVRVGMAGLGGGRKPATSTAGPGAQQRQPQQHGILLQQFLPS